MTKPSWFNFETVIQSLRDFIKSYPVQEGKRVYLVLDNAPWHKKAVRLVQTEAHEEYQDIREKLTLLFLPPYSPDLNPNLPQLLYIGFKLIPQIPYKIGV